MSLFNLFVGTSRKPSGAFDRRFRPRVEELESRVVPYSTTGDVWPHPELISLSFVPDGTNLGGVTSNLISTFNSRFGSAKAWQDQFRKAAQQWAAQTNINFTVIADGGASSGSGTLEQGASTMGDIRIGGYNFGASALAAADFAPSANNYSVAGDVTFNTGAAWNIGSDYDLYTVAMHEIGHALGLDHSGLATAVMFSAYTGAQSGLSSDDIAGIRDIYSGGNIRAADGYDASAANGTFAAASTITALINTTSKTALLNNLNISAASDVDYYKFTVPSGSSSTLKVTVQSTGLSLLAPRVWVYDGAQTQLATVSGLGQYGTTLTATVSGIGAGKTYYVKVAGADTTAFGTGKYAVTLNMGTGASPIVPLPNTATPEGNPLHSGGGLAQETLLGLLLGLPTNLLGILGRGIGSGYGDLLEADVACANYGSTPTSPASAGNPLGVSLTGLMDPPSTALFSSLLPQSLQPSRASDLLEAPVAVLGETPAASLTAAFSRDDLSQHAGGQESIGEFFADPTWIEWLRLS